ncbi:hypothetical protein Hrd1104_02955 [Halorhabdus sp. CBA1104]|uniref:DUF7123 family protein n=1 Tax=unclassified Halorhabdus TaxID=2621901 RepID=UPI0012B29018|nr:MULTISPECIES: hypothetical protein [unclassified Halorhabdus]QGN06355.1 hypothetical protein Hrd1104_02955 [Halorhabdus sp. CBA1104]
MSAETQPSGERDETATANKEERLRSFLKQKAADGEMYFKSKFIADEVNLSPKEIGALMVKLRESASDLSVEKWSYTSATTWRVEPA